MLDDTDQSYMSHEMQDWSLLDDTNQSYMPHEMQDWSLLDDTNQSYMPYEMQDWSHCWMIQIKAICHMRCRTGVIAG